jgi:hypothetical protein
MVAAGLIAILKVLLSVGFFAGATYLARSLRLKAEVGSSTRTIADAETTCNACIAEGKDYCLAENRCTERATFTCRGPHDHITGDKEFALHGNPEGIQHSMVCPVEKPSYNGQQDCYFDPECHSKVDWDKITKIKAGFFGRLKLYKSQENPAAVRTMVEKVHLMFAKAGMPEDRIDYILFKWVKSVYPESAPWEAAKAEKPRRPCQKGIMAKDDKHADKKDCFFDKECHAKVDWATIGKIKEGFFIRLKMLRAKGQPAPVRPMMEKLHHKFAQAGMPEDRIDYILFKWVKDVYPESAPWEAEEVMGHKEEDKKDCYFDPECAAKVDWDKIGKQKGFFFGKLKWFKEQGNPVAVKHVMENAHHKFAEAGMPEDRIDYILTKWVKFGYPESLAKTVHEEADKKDCYFDPVCHAKVDWAKIGQIKGGFFGRLKLLKEKGEPAAVRPMMGKVHHMFAEAGMPEDRIDDMITKWVKFAYLESLDEAKEMQKESEEIIT